MKMIFLLAALLISFSITAQKNTILHGKLLNANDDQVEITYYKGFALNDFDLIKIETTLDEKGNFTTALPLDAPTVVNIYFNATYYPEIGLTGRRRTQIFLEPGDSLAIDLSPELKGETITLDGKGAANNNFLVQFYHKFDKHFFRINNEKLSTAPVQDYIIFLDSFASAQHAFYNAHSARLTPQFKTYITNKITYYNALEKLKYPSLKEHETKEEVKLPDDYYNFLEKIQVQNDGALFMWEYVAFVNSLAGYEVKQLAKQKQLQDSVRTEFNKYLTHFTLTEKYFKDQTRNVILADITHNAIKYLAYPEAEKMLINFKSKVSDKALVDYLEKALEQKRLLIESEFAPAFTLKDTSGNLISLSDFRGKIVYISFWASWCGPCKAEAPHALKLQEKFKDKDVVFLYISTDESEQMWKKAIRTHYKGDGIHLNSKKTTENIQAKYNASGIPVYYLIDRKGKFLDTNATRPSEEVTAEILTEVLKL